MMVTTTGEGPEFVPGLLHGHVLRKNVLRVLSRLRLLSVCRLIHDLDATVAASCL